MIPALKKVRPEWIPAAVVLVVVLAAGSRLITLSMQQHAVQTRESAQALVTRHARVIESQLQALVELAQRQAARAAAGVAGSRDGRARLQSVAPGRNAFWITADGKALRSQHADPATVQGIAAEWASADTRGSAAVSGLLGPVRLGSQWILAVRTPILFSSGDSRRAGWAVAYGGLDQLLAKARIGQVAEAGYDFALLQLEPTSRRSRTFISSRTAPLSEPVTRTIRLPAAIQQSFPEGLLTLEVRPRGGWFPATRLAAQISLLAVIAWLVTLGAYDMTRTSSRLRTALAASRRQLQAISQRLMTAIEQRESLQKSFDHARYHDAFTGLPNRRYFMDQLDRALRELRTRRGQRIAIVLADIDRFKLINDTLGHTAGDELMVRVARRFETATAALECVLARWGGDQFAVLLVDVHSSETAIAIARMLQDALQAPISLRKHRLSVAARMGITCVDSGLQRTEDVMREADIALSVAKARERAGAVVYDATMGGDVLSLVSLEADLHVALPQREFRLLFQPIVDLRSQRIVGAEALLRWRHPVEGLLTPERFLAIAEEAGLIVPITRWVIGKVCRLSGEWRQRLPEGTDFYVSINLSAAVLRDPGLGDYVAGMLKETRTPAGSLKFELTEGGLISNVGAAREALDRLHGMGIELMLDDFGTGYSSLSYLQLFPFDYVKIDRPFASRTPAAQSDSGITCAMVQMVSSLGLKTVAEIVETGTAALALEQMGCDFAQGYYFCEPVEAEEALQRLRTQDLRTPFESPGLAATIVPKEPPVAPVKAAPAAATNRRSDESTLVEVPVTAAPSSRRGEDTLAETLAMAESNPSSAEATLAETLAIAEPGPSSAEATLAETLAISEPYPSSGEATLAEALATAAPSWQRDADTLVEPVVPPASTRPSDEDTLIETAVTTAPNRSSDDSSLLVETAVLPSATGAGGDSQTIAETAVLSPAAVPDEDIPTLVEAVEPDAESEPVDASTSSEPIDDDSPTLAETAILPSATSPGDDSHSLRLRRQRRARRS